MKTVADKVGVSSMTVSNAFSRPDQLSPALRERILATADELGYVGPDPAARTLARGTAGTIGLLLTESLPHAFTDEVSTTFLAAIAAELAPSGLALTLLTASGTGDVMPARDVAMDGALVYSCRSDSDAVQWLRKRRLPLVYVDQAPTPGIPSVNVDDRAGARAAAQHLVDLGHRRFGILTVGEDKPTGRDLDWYVARQRRLGWTDALHAAGATYTLVQRRHCNPEEGYAGAKELLASDPPTALLCISDAFAAGAMLACDDLGIRVPDELSVVGFDDAPLAPRLRPALTTVRQDITAKGRAAAEALIASMQRQRDNVRRPVRHLMLPTELITRASTAPPRSLRYAPGG
jgi:DNA-binding LacI/PurR family transcriptional regulator